jgi:hypothetical protein
MKKETYSIILIIVSIVFIIALLSFFTNLSFKQGIAGVHQIIADLLVLGILGVIGLLCYEKIKKPVLEEVNKINLTLEENLSLDQVKRMYESGQLNYQRYQEYLERNRTK